MKDNKLLKTFRFHPADIDKLVAHSKATGLAQTRIIERALAKYFDGIENGEPA